MPAIDRVEKKYQATSCGVATIKSYVETSSHVLTPNYREILAGGNWPPATPHDHFSELQHVTVGTWTNRNLMQSNPTFRYSGAGLTCFSGVIGEVSQSKATAARNYAISTAQNLALHRLRGQRIDLGVGLSQMKSTGVLIASTAVRLTSAFAKLKKGHLVDAVKVFGQTPSRKLNLIQRDYRNKRLTKQQFVANSWLEMQFGWKPLLSDVYGSAEALAEHNFLDHQRQVVGSGSGKASAKENVSPNFGNTSTTAKYKVTAEVKLHGVIADYDEFLQSSLGLRNPANIAWDILPFSFVADWFYPAGAVFKAFGATSGLSFLDGTLVVKTTADGTAEWLPDDWRVVMDNIKADRLTETYKRTVYGSFPGASFPPVNLTVAIDTWKVVTSIALLKQVFSKA